MSDQPLDLSRYEGRSSYAKALRAGGAFVGLPITESTRKMMRGAADRIEELEEIVGRLTHRLDRHAQRSIGAPKILAECKRLREENERLRSERDRAMSIVKGSMGHFIGHAAREQGTEGGG